MARRYRRPVCTTRDCGQCPGCKMRAAWALGRFAHRKKPLFCRSDQWSCDEEAWLVEHVGTMPLEELVERHAAEWGCRRTLAAFTVRIKVLGLSRYVQGWPMLAVEALFGVDHRAIARWWIRPGLLQATRWRGRGPNDGWWFEPAQIERFIRQYPWAYEAARMRPERLSSALQTEGRRLARLAALIQRGDPWRTRAEFCAFMGWDSYTPFKLWLGRGLIPHQRRYGAGGLGEIRIRRRDLPAIKAAIREAMHAHRSESATRNMLARYAAIRAARVWTPLLETPTWTGWRLEVAS